MRGTLLSAAAQVLTEQGSQAEERRGGAQGGQEVGHVPSQEGSLPSEVKPDPVGRVRVVVVEQEVSGELLDGEAGDLVGWTEALHAVGYDLIVYRVHDDNEREECFDRVPVRRNDDTMIPQRHLGYAWST
ncbi:hypothetical protein ACFVGP_03335 [Streptomyces rochei]|uniref:hypothetical protein n=1 Tax=Streptomyces TaxID=1883 RepID=UPI00163BA20B|nr:hypothetical protein [Streptomyces sp. WAC06273]